MNLAGARQRRPQLRAGDRRALSGAGLKLGLQVVVVGEQMDHCILAAAGAEVTYVYNTRIGQNARLVVVVHHELHRFLLELHQ